MRIEPNTAATMSSVSRDPTGPSVMRFKPASDAMLEVLARVRAGGVLVTAERKSRVNTLLMAELDGETSC